MTTLNRRQLLLGGGLITAGIAGGAITFDVLRNEAVSRPLAAGAGTLVIVTLYGGNDGLSTVVPYADNAYHDARPELAFTADEVYHLDDHYGLNPGMTGLIERWRDGEFAIIRGVGYPKPDHSHFRSMDIWQTASPESASSTGWVGRWLDATGDDPVRALCIGSTVPQLAIGNRASAAVLATSGVTASTLATKVGPLTVPDNHDTAAMAAVRSSYRASKTVTTTFAHLSDGGSTAGTDDGPGGSTGDTTDLGNNKLAAQLDVVARCITIGAPTRVYSVFLGGFDTHADEKGTQRKLLADVDQALTRFLDAMHDDDRGRHTVVMVYSEFGRRVRANASQGTDHGTAGPVLVLGPTVRGGFHGDDPSLTDLDDGDLKSTVDFRDVYHELLGKVVGADPNAVVPGRHDLGFLR
ncbi:DUF1501 domain-containing protein [Gordonia sp. TBRC 11910]|uniref:DUF1501 domain-containing protein n=1 Tax=Gordonia asplenii TaxID=2725283 RepID=A0A848KW28_9ACTN|nr:DUF1501 domain-containing protein [Gordonia asplenii]NMO03054.1 DUF1501 domain-containing protein [Gordonia asplenii]